jgi:hypothetical protein
MVLDRPEIPLHTDGSERDIRCQVIKRKISGGTHSDPGRDRRDAFLGLMHTCAKLEISFWDTSATDRYRRRSPGGRALRSHPLPRESRLNPPARVLLRQLIAFPRRSGNGYVGGIMVRLGVADYARPGERLRTLRGRRTESGSNTELRKDLHVTF